MSITIPIVASPSGAQSTVTLAAPVVNTGAVVPTGVPGSWRLTFEDTFTGTALDRTKWSDCWFSPGTTGPCGTPNYPANVAVSGGNLILTQANSTSGGLVSTNPLGGANGATVGFEFTLGVIEARMMIPGNGTKLYNWGGFWTSCQNYPSAGENDVAEIMSDGTLGVNYHAPGIDSAKGSPSGYWGDAFHTYTLNRKASSCDVYYDGHLVKSYTTADSGGTEYMILCTGVHGLAMYGTGSQIKVDYARAWVPA